MSSSSILGKAARSSLRSLANAGLRRTALAARSFVVVPNVSNVAQRSAASVGLRHSSTAVEVEAAAEAEDLEDAAESTLNDEPVELFSSLEGKIDPRLVKALTVTPFQYKEMSVVQGRVLPLLPDLIAPREPGNTNTKSHDLLVKARTGTGKTIGFLVPAIEARIRELEAISNQPSSQTAAEGARARGNNARRYAMENVGTLIISPTRELASQIAVEAQKLTSHIPGYGVSLFVGGVDKFRQVSGFQRARKDIVVATPGRLKDFLEDSRSGVREALKNTKMLILDEADTLLDMGFREDIESIMRELPGNDVRHTFLFSATVSKGIQQIASQHLAPNYQFVNCVSADTSEVHDHIPQYHTVIPSPEHQFPHVMRLLLQDQLEHGDKSKVVLFLPTTKMTQLTSSVLWGLARNVLPHRTEILELHSKKTMPFRTKAAEQFRRATRASILVTSDVSARGVDYPGVTRVIQLGLPKSPEQYVHRVGRTGRGSSKTGRGDLVLLDWEHEYVRRNYSHLPLKPLSVADLAAEVRGHVESAPEAVKERVSVVHGELESTVERFLKAQVDQEAVGSTMMSMIGFYAGMASGLRLDVDGIVEALKKWSTVGMGLDQAPYVGAAFLAKLGGGKSLRGGGDRRGGYGGGRPMYGDRGERTGFAQKREWRSDGGGRKPWESRGEGGAKPWESRREGGFSSRPWESRGEGGAKPWESRREGGSSKPWESRGERSSFTPREDGEGGGFHRRARAFAAGAGDAEGGGFRSREHVGRRTRSWEARNGGGDESPF